MQQFPIDDRITNWVVESRHEPLTSVVQLVTVFGDTLTLVLVVIGVFVLAWMGNRIDLSALIVFGGLSGYVLMLLLKLLFARGRPPIEDRLIDVGGASFPSGHAMLSTIVYGLSAVILFRLYPWVRDRPLILLWVPVLIGFIGLSRVYLGVHWMSDVVFGWLFGVLWILMCLVTHAQLVRRPALLRVGTKRMTTKAGQPRSGSGQRTSNPS
ncbi:phosphatase PAP2 family protein [Gordonia neofelifaecis]|uniref:Phosphoesterase PA-phosphatase related protein n=1 Tax=Gordonia neofelifaecis NRRL B-59395 TaxID=644548 RepID=F1YLX5_9ACTN|nr:phosphatase PAP2 family protein [Gordonia neofelifaecis]EGD54226.1 phosphoesterase PA-phosphatase related protein [Gordonia neofelifaecis NRRL B-59395]